MPLSALRADELGRLVVRVVGEPELVSEFDELTQKDMDETGDDPDEIVDRVQQKTGQPREQVEQRVQKVMQSS